MIFITCFRCDKELMIPGAVLLSPPREDKVIKYHLCEDCWKDLLVLVLN